MTDSQIAKIEKTWKVTHVYIRKHGMYYRTGAKAEGVDHARRCRDVIIIPIDVTAHNLHLLNKIDELTKNIIR